MDETKLFYICLPRRTYLLSQVNVQQWILSHNHQDTFTVRIIPQCEFYRKAFRQWGIGEPRSLGFSYELHCSKEVGMVFAANTRLAESGTILRESRSNPDNFIFGGQTSVTEDSEEYIQDIEEGDVTSFRDIHFKSEEMKHLLRLEEYTSDDKYNSRVAYNAMHMFPGWILENSEWQSTAGRNKDNKISEVLQTPFNQRTQEQTSTLIHWLMSVWETANLMGFKRCGAMTKVFHFLTYEPGEHIITEGERGLTFYIVISGDCNVYKEGIGKVAALTKGQSFGEIALTQGKDLRSATVQAATLVECLRLHKIDYDHFVKDIQLAERRENLQVLKSCKLFDHWSRAKIQKMVTTCLRKSYGPGDVVFHQGDPPDNIYFIVEGIVTIVKEIHIVVRNRWPTGNHQWDGVAKKKVKPIVVSELSRGSYFGELSIIKSKNRTATARAKTRCILLSLDKLEFVHLLRSGKTMETVSNFVTDYQNDVDILNTVADLRGGPSTTAQLNEYVKTAEIGSTRSGSPKHLSTVCHVSPTSPNPLDLRAHTTHPNKRPTGILRIPTNVYEEIGPNNGLPEASWTSKSKHGSKARKTGGGNSLGKDGIGEDNTDDTNGEEAAPHKHTTFKTLGKAVATLQDLNQTSMSSVTRFRKQLSSVTRALEDEKVTSELPLNTGNGPVRVEAHAPKGSRAKVYENKPGPAIMKDSGVEALRQMTEGIVTANRKLHYLDDTSALKDTRRVFEKDIDARHTRLRFGGLPATPQSYSSALSGRSVRSGQSPADAEAFPVGRNTIERSPSTKFKLKLDMLEKHKCNSARQVSTAPKRARNPHFDFKETKSQPVLLAINKVVMESSKGRKSRSDNADDIGEYVAATVRGGRPPSREVFTRSSSRECSYSPTRPYTSPSKLTSSRSREALSRQSSSALERFSRQSSAAELC